MKKHILIISQYFFPENFRVNDIASEWVKRGYEVTVVTGIPNYPEGKFFSGHDLFKKRKEVWNGVNIIRLPIIPRGNNAIQLVLNYLSFVVSGGLWSVFSKIRPNCIFMLGLSPMTQALPGVWLGNRLNIPCYLYVQDLWPENVEMVTGISNPAIINRIDRMVRYIYRNCKMILTTSNSFVQAIHDRDVPFEKLKYWPQYAEEFYQPLLKNKKTSAFEVVFTGNIGYAQGLEILPKAARRLKELGFEGKMRFVLVGEGRYKQELIDAIDTEQVSELFEFVPRVAATEIPSILSNYDMALLSLSESKLFSMTIPAKFQSYLACGKPVLGVVTGEVATMIEENKLGYVSTPGDVEGLVQNVIHSMSLTGQELNGFSERAITYYQQYFDKDKLLDEIDYLFSSSNISIFDIEDKMTQENKEKSYV